MCIRDTSNHINHVQTQMLYAMVVVAACVPGYLIAGFTENLSLIHISAASNSLERAPIASTM